MPYGAIKVDNITFTNDGADQATTVSGIYRAITSGVTVTGTISGATIQGASGTFTSLTGVTTTGTTANFVTHNGASGVFTTLLSGATVTGTTAQFTNITGGGIGATTITGTTVTGTTANFVSGVFTTQISGATVTGTTANFTSGNFTALSGASTTVTSGIFAVGSAAAPSISFASDPNTGIYSPGADQVAISTGGSGRLFVDASGNVGVGTTTPSATLELSGTGTVFKANTLTTTSTAISLQLGGYVTTSNTGCFIKSHINLSSTLNSQLSFEVNGGALEAARIDSSGRVGIGTSSPGSSLHVNTASGDCKQTISASAGTTSAFTAFVNTTVTTVGTENSAGGNLVAGSSAYATILSNNGAYPIQFGTNNTVRATLDSSGRLGIGTTSPTSKLDLVDTAADSILSIRAGSTFSPSIYFEASGSNAGAIKYDRATQALTFSNNSSTSERLRIDQSGRLLVGTSTASTIVGANSAVQIYGTTYDTASLAIRRSSSTAADSASLYLGRERASGTSVANNDRLGLIAFGGHDGTDLDTGAAFIEAWVDGTPGSNDMPGRLVFSTTADGAASPTERMRIGNIGYLKVSNAGVYTDTGGGSRVGTTSHFFRSDQNAPTIFITNTNTSSAVEGFTSDFPAGATGNHFIGANALGRVFIVAANGNVTNTNNSYGAISDIKLKENIVNANSQWDDLKALQVRNYNFKEGQTHTQIGLVAQEVELVSPGLVSESPDLDAEGNDLGTVTKSVNYSVLYMKAVKALQEAMERIEALEADVAQLKGA